MDNVDASREITNVVFDSVEKDAMRLIREKEKNVEFYDVVTVLINQEAMLNTII